MTGRTAPLRGALPWRRAGFSALCIVMLVVASAVAASLPDLAATTTADQSATPEAMATPSVEPEVDWSNGAMPIWTYESGTDHWAGNFPSGTAGVFAVYKSSNSVLQVFDAMTFEQLWLMSVGDGSYSWRVTKEVFLIANESELTARDPRNGHITWTYYSPQEEWEWTTDDHILWLVPRPPRYVYVTNDEQLTVLDLSSGEKRFEMNGTGDTFDWKTEDDIMTITRDNRLTVVDLDTGKERWHYAGEGTGIGWRSDDNKVYVTSGSVLSVLDSATGEEIWQFSGSGESISWTSEGDALYASSGRSVSAIDPESGTELWRFTGADDGSSPRIIDGALFVRSGADVSSVDPDTGVELWRFTAAEADDLSWDVTDAAGLYVVSGDTFTVLDPQSGVERWHFTSNGTLDWWWMDDDILTFVAEERLIEIDASTGAERWRSSKLPEVRWSPLLDHDTYLVEAGTSIFLISAKSGEILRQIDTRASDSWIVDDGVLFVADGNALAAYDLRTGMRNWQQTEHSSGSLRFVDETLLLMTSGHTLLALDRSSGIVRWTFDAQASIASFEMDDGIIRLTDDQGTLYALAPKPIQLGSGGAAVTTEEVTLHGAPNAASVERATLPAGTAVTVTGASDDHDGVIWWPVRTDEAGVVGWVPADTIAPTGNSSSAPATPLA